MPLILRLEQVFARRRTKAQTCAASQLQLALLYVVALERLRLRACVFCRVDRTHTLCPSRACCLLQTALGIMSTFAVGTTSAIDYTSNTCANIYMHDTHASHNSEQRNLLENSQNDACDHHASHAHLSACTPLFQLTLPSKCRTI
jgi:hypothetical protein